MRLFRACLALSLSVSALNAFAYWEAGDSFVFVHGGHFVRVTRTGETLTLGKAPESVMAVEPVHGSASRALVFRKVGLSEMVPSVVDLATGAEVVTFGKDVRADSYVVSQFGSLVAFGTDEFSGAQGSTWIFDTTTGKLRCKTDVRFFQGAFTRSDQSLVVTMNGLHTVIDTQTCKTLAEDMSGTGGTFGSSVSPDGEWVASSAGSGHQLEIKRTSAFSDLAVLHEIQGCTGHVNPSWNSNGSVVFEESEGFFYSYRLATRSEIGRIYRGDERVVPFDDGQKVAMATPGAIHIVDLRTNRLVCSALREGEGSLSVSPSGEVLISISQDGSKIVLLNAGDCSEIKPSGH